MGNIKKYFHYLLEAEESRARRFFNMVMIIIVILSVLVMILEVDPDLGVDERRFLAHVDFGFTLIFLVEYVLRFWVCSDFLDDYRRALLRLRRRHLRTSPILLRLGAVRAAMGPKLRWMAQPMSVVDLLAVLPIFRPFRLLRVLRILRLLKLFRYSRRLSIFVEVIHERRYELTSAMFTGIVIWTMVAVAFYEVERGQNPELTDIWTSFYFAIITMATVGYGDITPSTEMGRVIAIIGIFLWLWITVYLTSIIVSALTERVLILKEHRMESRVDRLRNHFIVCGLKDLGREVCSNFAQEGTPFVGVDLDTDRVAYATAQGWHGVKGDITDEAVWKNLGLERARGVISTITAEASNVYLILTVREQRQDCLLVVRGGSEASEKRLLRLGATRVISPSQIGGVQMTYAALKPTALQFMDFAMQRGHHELEMEELLILPNSRFNGLSLMESNIRRDFEVIVVGVVPPGGRMVFNPKANFILKSHHTLICMGHFDDLARLREAFSEGSARTAPG